MRTITIRLPLPPRALHPNARAHWSAKARATRLARQQAFIATVEATGADGQQAWPAAAWRAEYHFRVNRHRDEDGLVAWLKAYLDGVIDARLIAGDDRRYLRMAAPPAVTIDKHAGEGVTLTFTACARHDG